MFEQEFSQLQLDTEFAVTTRSGAELVSTLRRQSIEIENIMAEAQDRVDTRASFAQELQPLKVPEFSGEVEKFEAYWAMVEDLVLRNDRLSDLRKLIYIEQSLIGDAARIIKGITIKAENLQWVIDELKRHFRRNALSRASIVQKLINLEPAKNASDDSLRVMFEIKAIINQMVSSGHDIRNSQDPLWIDIIHGKLHRKVLQQLLPYEKHNANMSISSMCDKLENIIEDIKYTEDRLKSFQSIASHEQVTTKFIPKEQTGPAIKSEQRFEQTEKSSMKCDFFV
jgi:hypothetical protein